MIAAVRKETGKRFQHDFQYIFEPSAEAEDADSEVVESNIEKSASTTSTSTTTSSYSSSSRAQPQQRYCIGCYEDTEKVDGIGGVNWDGAIVMSHFLRKILENYKKVLKREVKNAVEIMPTGKNDSAITSISGGAVDEKAAKSRKLERYDTNRSHIVVELGCGTGLCSIVSYLSGASVISTDRYSDLASQNIGDFFLKYPATSSNSSSSNSDISRGKSSNNSNNFNRINDSNDKVSGQNRVITSLDLEWGDLLSIDKLKEAVDEVRARTNNCDNKKSDFKSPPLSYIIGSEICCLNKQHDKLIETIKSLHNINIPAADNLDSNYNSENLSNAPPVVLLSFDGTPATRDYKYFHEFVAKMKGIGYSSSICVGVGEVHWEDVTKLEADTFAETYFQKSSSKMLVEHSQNSQEQSSVSSIKVAKFYNLSESFIKQQVFQENMHSVRIDLKFLYDNDDDGRSTILPEVTNTRNESYKESNISSSIGSIARKSKITAEVTSHQIILFYCDQNVILCPVCGCKYIAGFRPRCGH